MSCKDCYGCIFMHNHTVVDKTAEIQEVDKNISENEKSVEVFKTRRTLSGKLIGVKNETETLDKKDS